VTILPYGTGAVNCKKYPEPTRPDSVTVITVLTGMVAVTVALLITILTNAPVVGSVI
jgi:hypothetical protein